MRVGTRVLVVATLAAIALLAVSARAVVARDSRFRSPSNNIGCILDWVGKRGFVRCDVRVHTWHAPRPARCPKEFEFGDGFDVSHDSRRGSVVCATDTVQGPWRHLPYGHSIIHAGIRCTSTQRGVTCRNRRHHGFFVSRSRYRLF